MRAAAALALLAAIPACPARAQESRLWWGEVAAAGPLDTLELHCGADGSTRVALGLVRGEERMLALPVPVRAPLGSASLAGLPPPRLTLEGAGTATWLGWRERQPEVALLRLPPGLRARPRPPAAAATDGPRLAEVALLCGAALLVLGARRRPLVALALGAGAAAAGFALARSGATGGGAPTRVLDLDLGGEAALESSAGERLEVVLEPDAPEWLEVEPAAAGIRLALALDGERLAGVAAVAAVAAVGTGDASLVLRRARTGEAWSAEGAPRELEATWTRTPGGTWRAHGRWPAGAPLPPEVPSAPAPPGWLAAGLPPGVAVLLGREGEASWLRATGFR